MSEAWFIPRSEWCPKLQHSNTPALFYRQSMWSLTWPSFRPVGPTARREDQVFNVRIISLTYLSMLQGLPHWRPPDWRSHWRRPLRIALSIQIPGSQAGRPDSNALETLVPREDAPLWWPTEIAWSPRQRFPGPITDAPNPNKIHTIPVSKNTQEKSVNN